MANEGEFPKVDGDILFASEANRLGFAPRYIFIGSTITHPSSGTSPTDVGSVIINTGSLSNPATLNFDFHLERNIRLEIEISGLGVNSSLALGDALTTSEQYGTARAVVGSPLSGFFHGWIQLLNATSMSTGSYDNVALNNLDTGSTVVIKFRTISDRGDRNVKAISIQSFRGNL
ncbi:MAG: hypothetical protein IH948_00015 [Bacteroidetes bacterium]|nr:hypothetical protein [Bacteroidota bacterium]